MKGIKSAVNAFLLTVVSILLNLAGKWIALHWQLPLWMDCCGTVIAAYILGPVGGAAAGLAANVIYGVFNGTSQIYGLTSVAVGLIVGFAARKKKLETLFSTMAVCSLTTLVSL